MFSRLQGPLQVLVYPGQLEAFPLSQTVRAKELEHQCTIESELNCQEYQGPGSRDAATVSSGPQP